MKSEKNIEVEFKDQFVDRYIGENASQISGGQRQRLFLIKAFMSQKKILIFDEVKASDSVLTSLSIQINKNEEQIDILWRNIREHNAIFDEIKETLNALIQEFQERKIEIDDDIAMINVDINDLRLSTDDMQNVLNSEINFLQNELKTIKKRPKSAFGRGSLLWPILGSRKLPSLYSQEA